MKLFTLKAYSFKSYMALSLIFLATIAFGWIFYRTALSEDNEQAYHRLIASADPANSNLKASPYTASQQRKAVRKDIFFIHDADRLQVQLFCTDSVLVLDNQGNGLDLIENMQNVKCLMQEELYYLLPDGREVLMGSKGKFFVKNEEAGLDSFQVPLNVVIKPMQRVRYLEAAFATYFYNNDKFVAHDVKINTYEMPLHNFPHSFEGFKPTMMGTAKSLEFFLRDKKIEFTAKHLKATFFEKGKFF